VAKKTPGALAHRVTHAAKNLFQVIYFFYFPKHFSVSVYSFYYDFFAPLIRLWWYWKNSFD